MATPVWNDGKKISAALGSLRQRLENSNTTALILFDTHSFPANTTSVIQPLDYHIIKNAKALKEVWLKSAVFFLFSCSRNQ
jgi:hypothetical protein